MYVFYLSHKCLKFEYFHHNMIGERVNKSVGVVKVWKTESFTHATRVRVWFIWSENQTHL